MATADPPISTPTASNSPKLPSILLLLLLLLAPPVTLLLTHHFPPRIHHIRPEPSTLTALPPPLTFVTLSFNQSTDDRVISHNCVLISRSLHRLYIHTDSPTKPFCSLCTCIPYTPINCTCATRPSPSPPKSCVLCEKLHLIDTLLTTLPNFVYLDTDLVILNPDFMDRLSTRTTHVDFLASYGFDDPCTRQYGAMFNSGLFFIRRIAHWRQGMLVNLMSSLNATNDQNVISAFVYKAVQEWDTLDMQWHCRFLQRRNYSIPPEKCYTLHGRGPGIKETLRKLNRTLLSINTAP
eukprot:GFKZ01000754.1.p1 GENE.GFKZ01000754.1~~GFKZ01000754.1.p1  ORF type:complete len:294 (+),score=11.87 GFKZ01000754.1:606-1487(+)